MAKGFNRPPGGGGQGGMMQQIQKLQQQMAEAQEKLAAETVTATAGGGLGLGIGVGLELPPWRGAGSGGNTPEAPTQAATLQVRTCQWRPWPRRVAVWVRYAGGSMRHARGGNAARGRLGPDTGPNVDRVSWVGLAWLARACAEAGRRAGGSVEEPSKGFQLGHPLTIRVGVLQVECPQLVQDDL